MRNSILTGLLVLALTVPVSAGPWPRGEGRTFLSVSSETRQDMENPRSVPEYDATLFAEYGIGPRLTFGIDAYKGPFSDTTLVYLRRTLTAPDRRHQLSVRLGGGTRADDATGRTELFLLGGAWGMGFDTPWGPGWTVLDGQMRQRAGGGREVKLDATAGLWVRDDWAGILQLQGARFPGGAETLRLQATAVRKIRPWLSLESGVVYGLRNDSRAGVKAGIWTEF